MKNGETIYFDYAATTFHKPESVYQAMDDANRHLAVNAGRGSYALAQQAVKLVDQTREMLLHMVNGRQVAEVVITASATIAFNQIIGGIAWTPQDVVYVTPYEHNAVMRPLYMWQKKLGFEVIELPLTDSCEIDLEKTEFLFAKKPPKVLFATHLSNVTGYILPIEALSAIAKRYEAAVVIDASQSLGLVDIDLQKLPVDYLVFAGHKNLYGPFGVGGFFMRKGCRLNTYLAGGTGSDSLNLDMPEHGSIRYEAASQNIVAIAGLHAALIEWKQIAEKKGGSQYILQHEMEQIRQLREMLEQIRGITLYLPPENVHAGIIALNISGYQSTDVGMILDEDYDIAVRTGYHCAPLIHKHLQDENQLGAVRLSIGRFTTKQEIDTVAAALRELVL